MITSWWIYEWLMLMTWTAGTEFTIFWRTGWFWGNWWFNWWMNMWWDMWWNRSWWTWWTISWLTESNC